MVRLNRSVTIVLVIVVIFAVSFVFGVVWQLRFRDRPTIEPSAPNDISLVVFLTELYRLGLNDIIVIQAKDEKNLPRQAAHLIAGRTDRYLLVYPGGRQNRPVLPIYYGTPTIDSRLYCQVKMIIRDGKPVYQAALGQSAS